MLFWVSISGYETVDEYVCICRKVQNVILAEGVLFTICFEIEGN